MLLFLLAACGSGEPTEALVLTGWQYEWAQLSHRIGYLRVGLEQDSSLQLGLMGGDWSTGESASDLPTWRVRYARVRAPGTSFQVAEAELMLGPEWSGTSEVVFPDAGGETLVALLQGFSIDPGVPQTEDYPDYEADYGYTTQGFGFALGEPERRADGIAVPVTATVRWSPQDRADMNAAIPHARTGVTVRVMLVATDGAVERAPLSASTLYPEGITDTEQPPLVEPVTLSGRGREGFVGWTRVDLQGNFFGPDVGWGDYVRAMGVEVEAVEDAPATFTGEVTATFTNRSFIQLTQWAGGFTGELVRVGVDGAEVEHFVVDGEHPVGLADYGPTLP